MKMKVRVTNLNMKCWRKVKQHRHIVFNNTCRVKIVFTEIPVEGQAHFKVCF